MRITYSGKDMQVTDAIKARVEKKLNKLDRYFRDDAEVTVRLSQEKGARNIAELTMTVGGLMIRAEEITDDMYQSVDRAADKLEKQIQRHRKRFDKKVNVEALAAIEDAPVPAWEDTPDELVRVKRFTVKPMSVEDAIAQMDMLGHSFFVFVNDETNITSVIYRRTDGTIGMLEPVLG